MRPTKNIRNKNFGNLEAGSFCTKKGATGSDGRFATFSSHAEGVVALASLLAGGSYRNRSIQEAFARFAPQADANDPDNYARVVAKGAGVPGTTKICDLNPFQFLRLLTSVGLMEGGREEMCS